MVVTTQSNGNGRRAFQALGGLGVALLIAAACAGTDTPPRTRSLEAEVIERYDPDFATGNAGSSSMAGAGGSGSGQGGSASTNAGAGGSGAPAGGSSGGGSAGSGSSAVCNAPVEVLIPKCGQAGCHGAGAGVGNFGESEAAALAAVGDPSGCDDLPYFDPADPQNSAVVIKLADMPDCGGAPMPLIGDPLTQDEVDCILEWAGAQN